MDKLIKAQYTEYYVELREIKGLRWPRPQEIIEISKRRNLTSNELLALLSRTFYPPIWLLELNIGKNENNKRRPITDFYNVLRFIDTIEDARPEILSIETKRNLIDSFVRVIEKVQRRNKSESIEDLVSNELTTITNTLKPGVMNQYEEAFVEHFRRGGVLRSMKKNASDLERRAIYMCTSSMAIGMKDFLGKKIDTIERLREYCDYVAGYVGTALTEIVDCSDGVQLKEARMFGRALQIVNVLKDPKDDYEKRRVVYLPEELLGGLSHEELFNPDSVSGKQIRRAALNTMISHARDSLRQSMDYVSSIPERLTGYRGFTMIPLFAAIETLNRMKREGAEAVFNGKKEAIKMGEGTGYNLGRFVYSILKFEDGKRTDKFLELYKKSLSEDPERYSFEPGKFEEWTKDF